MIFKFKKEKKENENYIIEIEKKGDELEKELENINLVYLQRLNDYSNLCNDFRIA